MRNRIIAKHAFTLIEATLSTVVVGIMLVAALSALGAARLGEQRLMLAERGLPLAEELMAEILSKAYSDPDGSSSAIGPDTGESAATHRMNLDDIDDYDGWSASPPVGADGTEYTWYADWQRKVEVDWVEVANPETVAASDKGVKRIVVSVLYNGETVAELKTLRFQAWPALTEMHEIDDEYEYP